MDDFSVPPSAPELEIAVTEDEQLDLRDDQELAKAYFHPAWAKVEELFKVSIEDLASVASIDKNLPSDEYKVEAIANLKALAVISQIWGSVKDAVQATESVEQPTTKGGK